MCTDATAERVLELIKAMSEDEALEVLDFAEFLKARRQRDDQEDIEDAKEVLQRIDRGEEASIPWEDVKAEYGL